MITKTTKSVKQAVSEYVMEYTSNEVFEKKRPFLLQI